MKEKKKKTHGIKLLIRCIVRDPDGKIISDTGTKPAKSFVIQFLEYIHGLFRYTGTISATAIDGSEDMIYEADYNVQWQFNAAGGAGSAATGIVVGTGDTAETNTDYVLETQIAQGMGAGQLSHGSTTFGDAAVVGANVDAEIVRSFTNNSGSSITVKEAGIYTFHYPSDYHMIARDVLPGPVSVPNRCSLSIIYTFRTTV